LQEKSSGYSDGSWVRFAKIQLPNINIKDSRRRHELTGSGGLQALQLMKSAVQAALKGSLIAGKRAHLGGAVDKGAGEGDDIRRKLLVGIKRWLFEPMISSVLETALLLRLRSVGIGHRRQAHGGIAGLSGDEDVGTPIEQTSFDVGDSPESPSGSDNTPHQDLFHGSDRLELSLHSLLEALEFGGIFAAHQGGL